jgi:hypothetical protein
MKYIYRISPAIYFLLGSSNLFLPAISKICGLPLAIGSPLCQALHPSIMGYMHLLLA